MNYRELLVPSRRNEPAWQDKPNRAGPGRFSTSTTGAAGLHKLNTTTGAVTGFQLIAALDLGADAFTRVLLSNDNARAYINVAGLLVQIDTATDTMVFNPVILASDYELTLSSNQTWMSATEYLMDTNLNPESFLTLTDRQSVTTQAVFGAKLSPDGALLFQPLVDGIAVFDGKPGTLRTRIALPVQLSANYDALVADGQDNVLVGITGQKGDGGVSVIDLTGLPVPAPLPFAANFDNLPQTGERLTAASQIRCGAPCHAATSRHSQSCCKRRSRRHRLTYAAGNQPIGSSARGHVL